MIGENLVNFAAEFQPSISVSILIRPLRIDDLDIEETFIRELSAEICNKRLLGGARRITPEYVARLRLADYPREFALAALVMLGGRETLLGVAPYAMDRSDDGCESAVVIADAWQGHGLGKHLLECLIEAARAHDIPSLWGLVISSISYQLRLARELGSELRTEPGDARPTQVERVLFASH